MKNKGLLKVLSIPALGFLISSGLVNKNASFNDIEIKNKSYIVLFDSEAKKSEFNFITASIKDHYDIEDEYSGLMSGYLIRTSKNVSTYLSGLSCVSHINEDKVIYESTSTFYDSTQVFTTPLTNNSKEDMGIPSKSNEGEGTLIAILDDSFSLKHEVFQDLSSSDDKKLSKDDVDKIVKSGDLKIKKTSSYYYNSKIPFYHDYGGTRDYKYDSSEGYYYTNIVDEDDDVETIYDYHGMHVSSIAGANGKTYEGIAPKAQLALMKVSSTVDIYDTKGSKTGTSEQLLDSCYLKALNDCYTLGVDVINMSFGASLNEFGDSSSALAIKKLEEKGVVVAASAGNDGKGNYKKFGAYSLDTVDFVNSGTMGTMSLYEGATSVASSNISSDTNVDPIVYLNEEQITVYDEILASNHSSDSEYAVTPNMPFVSLLDDDEIVGEFEYVIVPGVGKESDYSGIDVKGKIALILRGDIDFQTKISNAKNKGAIGCIIGNTEDATFGMGFNSGSEDLFIPTVAVSSSTYTKLTEASEKKITLTKEVISDFSSEGTTDLLEIANDIATPGNNVAGAINVVTDSTSKVSKNTYNTYAYMSGTSMASPNYAGAASLILSEQNFKNEEEELEYKKTLLARVMSTADPLSEDIKDEAPISVRKQGAGEIDVSAVLASKVYLTGSDETSAKVELKNNDDIKNGNIKFDVTFNNPEKVSGSYKATLYVTTNDTEVYHKEGSDFDGVTMKKDKSKLLAKVDLGSISLSKEETQKFSVDYSLSEEIKKELDETFTSGTFIEGYVDFESTTSSPSLSIPYMGYYGDYKKVDCVEKFDFEKKEGELLQSDLLNDLAHNELSTTYAKPNANFNSLIGVTNGGSSIKGISDILENASNPYDLYNRPITYIDEEGITHIKCGVKNVSDTLYIQQFVNRSVKDNTLTFTNEKGETVLTDHMFDALYGESDDGTHPLYKSVATTSLLTKDYIAHRAYTILALKDKKNGTFYEDGTYTMRIVYNFSDGTSQTLTYKLDILNEAEDVSVESGEIKDNKLTINGSFASIRGLSSSCYSFSDNVLSIDLTNISEEEITYFNLLSNSYSQLNCFYDPLSKTILLSENLTDSVTYSVKATVSGDKVSYKLSIKNKNDKEISLGKSGAKFLILGDDTYSSKIVDLTQNDKSFEVNRSKSGNDTDSSSSSNAAFIAAICVVGVVLILGGVGAAAFIQKAKKKKNQ